MQIYFFHLRDGTDIALDPEGRSLDGLVSVAGAALVEARAIISADALDGWIFLDQRIDVEDESGALVHRLPFGEAVKIVAPDAPAS